MRRLGIISVFVAVLLSFVVGCRSDSAGGGDELRIVASTALIAEFASVVVGDDAVVVGLIPAGVDAHGFEPSPSAAASIAQADLILVNGYNLEEALLDVIERNASDAAMLVAVSAGIEVEAHSHEGDAEDDHEDEADAEVDHVALIRAEGDPHLWLDARNAMRYVENIRDALIELNPGGADGYRERAERTLEDLQELDDAIVAQISDIPKEARQLVVFHDAYRYFADAYGLELLATVLPAGAQQDPAAGTVAELIELLEGSGVRTVFAEPQFSAAVLEQIADEAGVEVGTLYSTFAGDVDSYEELMRANADALTAGLQP